MDVDIVVDLQILANTDAYHTLEENLRAMGFERGVNRDGTRLSWRWQIRTESGTVMLLELLTDAPDIVGGKVQPLPTDGALSAMNIPHSSIVFDLHDTIEIRAELLGGNGIAIEKIKHADIVSFTCMKAFAYDHRHARKDAHDLIYCLEHYTAGPAATADAFCSARRGKHAAVVEAALHILRQRFASDARTEGYRKDGPVSVARFEWGDSNESGQRDARILRQREACEVIESLLARIGQ